MKILVINQFGEDKIVDAESVPQIGAMVDLFYRPRPIVKSVLMWPSEETLKAAKLENINIEAIVTV